MHYVQTTICGMDFCTSIYKKEKRNTCTMSRKNKDVEYKNIICSLALDDMLDHNYWVCTNAMLS